jgi:hypothetical protein
MDRNVNKRQAFVVTVINLWFPLRQGTSSTAGVNRNSGWKHDVYGHQTWFNGF